MAVDVVIGFDSLAIVLAIGVLLTWAVLLPAAALPNAQADRVQRETMRLFGCCLVLLWLTSLAWLWTRTAAMSGQPPWAALSVVPTVLFRTHFGAVWWLRAAAVVASTLVFVFVLWRRRRLGWITVVALLVALGWIVASRSASGHAAANGDWTLREAMDWLHFVAIAVWGGTVLATVLLLFPRLRRVSHATPGRFALRFSRLATGALAIVLITGIYNTWHMLPTVGALWSSHYGRLLAIKLLFVAAMIACGAINHYRLVPRLQTASVLASATWIRRLQMSVVLESLLLLLILAVTALLLGSMPPMG